MGSPRSDFADFYRSSRYQLAWLTLDRRRVWESADGLKRDGAWIDALRVRRLPWSRPAPATGLGASWYSLPAERRPGAPPLRGTYEFLTTLPTNPVTLRAWIYGHLDGGQPPDDQAWTDITDLLGGMLVPPKLAAALFKVAATIPGATVKPHVIDAAGRAGIAVARVGQEYPEDNELIFDPRTYRLLGQRSTRRRTGAWPVSRSCAGAAMRPGGHPQWRRCFRWSGQPRPSCAG